MKPPISNRLLACCAYVRPHDRVADIGTDHGYLGIYLLLQGTARFVLASDVSQAPLDAAIRNAEKYGVRSRMAFYLSDGLQKLPRDFDCLVCAGMGCDTILHILGAAPWLKAPGYRLILQCQSQRPRLRRWLWEQGYAISRETLAQDGRFLYPVMEAGYGPSAAPTPGDCYLSPALRASGSPLLPAFYERVQAGLQKTAQGLAQAGNEEKLAFYERLLEELKEMEESIYDHSGGRCEGSGGPGAAQPSNGMG